MKTHIVGTAKNNVSNTFIDNTLEVHKGNNYH